MENKDIALVLILIDLALKHGISTVSHIISTWSDDKEITVEDIIKLKQEILEAENLFKE